MKKLSVAFITLLLISACGGSSSNSGGGTSTGNTAPLIDLSDNNFVVDEGDTTIGTISASDADGDDLTFSLQGEDEDAIAIGSTSGALSFNSVTDFEAAGDFDEDNEYLVTVVVTDGAASDARDLIITVKNVIEAPTLSVTIADPVEENQQVIGTYEASTEGTITITKTGEDEALIALTTSGSSGTIAFIEAPDYETPTDADGDGVYKFTLTVTNEADSVSENIAVTVTDVVENASDLFISEVTEGTSYNKYVEIYNGTGQDVSLADYALINTTNAPAVPGEYEYWNEEIFGDATSIADSDVHVVCDPRIDESLIHHCDSYHRFLSNGDDGFALVNGGTWVDAIQDGDDAVNGEIDEGEVTGYTIIDTVGNFDADPGSGWDVCGVSAGTKDHTLVKKQKTEGTADWAVSAGTSASDCHWIVSDKITSEDPLSAQGNVGKHCFDDSQTATVKIGTAAALTAQENQTAVTAISAALGGAACSGATYSISGGNDAALFAIGADTGLLTFATAPDFETATDADANGVYEVEVTVTSGDVSDSKALAVTVTDFVGNPVFKDSWDQGAATKADDTFTTSNVDVGWEGNANAEIFPLTATPRGKITFKASVPSGGDSSVKFKFEANPWPNNNPSFETATVPLSGATEKTYAVTYPNTGDSNWNQFVMFLQTADEPTVIKDVEIGVANIEGKFTSTWCAGAIHNADTSTYITDNADCGFANANGQLNKDHPYTVSVVNTDVNDLTEHVEMLPVSFKNGGNITFKASASADTKVRFKFEKNPWPDVVPNFFTEYVTVSGAEEAEYNICINPEETANADRLYTSYILFLGTLNQEVMIKDVKLVENATSVECPTLQPYVFVPGKFGDATVDTDTNTYNHETGAFKYGGFSHDDTVSIANGNLGAYPLTFVEDGKVTFNGSVPGGGDNEVWFVFENAPYPNHNPNFESSRVTVSGDTTAAYEVTVPKQDADQTFSSWILYITENGPPVTLTDITLYADKKPEYYCGVKDGGVEGGGGEADFCEAFGAGAVYDDEDSSYVWTVGADSWSGFANKDTSLHPLTLSGGATITFDASVPDGDVDVYFKFENEPHPNNTVFVDTDAVTVTGTTETTYTIIVPAQTGDKDVTYNNFLMYVEGNGKKVIIKNVNLAPNTAYSE
jgi:hypothetical protein